MKMKKIAVAVVTLAFYAGLGAAAIVKLVENPKWDLRCKLGQAAPELCPNINTTTKSGE